MPDAAHILAALTVISLSVGSVAGALAIWRQFKKESRPPYIQHPRDGMECGGRYVTISGRIPRRRRGSRYWIAIQPGDSSIGFGTWWPQRKQLAFATDGSWLVERATLGRQGTAGEADIGKTYTIALFELSQHADAGFAAAASDGERLKIPAGSTMLESISVKRVEH